MELRREREGRSRQQGLQSSAVAHALLFGFFPSRISPPRTELLRTCQAETALGTGAWGGAGGTCCARRREKPCSAGQERPPSSGARGSASRVNSHSLGKKKENHSKICSYFHSGLRSVAPTLVAPHLPDLAPCPFAELGQ